MGLANLKVATETIKLPGGDSFTVRGLSFADISILFFKHRDTMSLLYQQAMEAQESDDAINMIGADVATMMLNQAPILAAEIIAIADYDPAEFKHQVSENEEDETDPSSHYANKIANARMLPATIQIEAIEKIGNLTFAVEGGPKKVIETVIRMMRGVSNTIASFRTGS